MYKTHNSSDPDNMCYVYIAGPYTHPDPVANTRAAMEMGDRLAVLGMAPYVPHLSLFWHLLFPHPVDWWYEFDLHWLARCDCLLRLPGESKGADDEVEYALAHGIPVFRSLDGLLHWWAEKLMLIAGADNNLE